MSIVKFNQHKKVAILIFFFFSVFIFSQKKITKLPNNLDVFVQKNTSKQKETLFYLLVKTGSINETDEQLGYAHFIEHLAFKKGKRFKNNSVTNFFKQQGLRVGEHYNAITLYDYTLYQIKIPKEVNKLTQRKIFLFFADVLNGLELTQQDINTERKIILAEKNARVYPKIDFNFKLGNSLYLNRLPIGTEKSINEVTPLKIREFYTKWYQPKNSAVFVVGDVNIAETSKLVREILGDIPNTSSAKFKPKSIFKKLDDEIHIETDSNLKKTKINLFLPSEYSDDNKEVKAIFNIVLKNRIKKALEKQVSYSSIYSDYFLSDVYYNTISTDAKNNSKNVLKTIFTEIKRMKDFGISNKELDFYKNKFRNKKQVEQYTNAFIIDQVIASFLKNNSFRFTKNLNLETLNAITTSDFKKYNDNFFKRIKTRILIEKSSEKITEKDIKLLLKTTKNKKLKPYIFVEQVEKTAKKVKSNKKLEIASLQAKKPIEIKKFKKLGVTKLVYKNGISVLLKSIKNGSKEMSVIATAEGGYSDVSDENFYKYESTDSYMELGGVANLGYSELEDYLGDKPFGLSLVISDFERLIHGYTSEKGQKEFFKFLYAKLTTSKADKKEFDKVITNEISSLKKTGNNTIITKKDKLVAELMGHHFPQRRTVKTKEDYLSLDVFEMQKFYQKSFKYANNWNYVVIGDFSENTVIPLINKYIGNLKHTKNPINNKVFNYQQLKNNQQIKSQNPSKNYIAILYIPYDNNSLEQQLMLSMYEKYMQLKITELLREKKGLVYSPMVKLDKTLTKNAVATIEIEYFCDKKLFEKSKKELHQFLKEVNGKSLKDEVFQQLKSQARLPFEKVFSSKTVYLWASKLSENNKTISDLENINTVFKQITKKKFSNFLVKIKKNEQIKSIEVN